jgi:uncharacterized RDD family membrane protein YckC
MNKTLILFKKISAFVIDLIICWLLLFPLDFIAILILDYSLGKQFVIDYFSIIETVNIILILILYFVFVPKKFGNTFGRKILKIKDSFNIFRCPLDKLDKYQKKDELE